MTAERTAEKALDHMADLMRKWARQVDDELDLDGVAEGLRRYADRELPRIRREVAGLREGLQGALREGGGALVGPFVGVDAAMDALRALEKDEHR